MVSNPTGKRSNDGTRPSNQFEPKPLAFDLSEGSPFQKQLMQVFNVTNELNDEQLEIAQFWDCNPYVTHHRGHAMFATKKITPGGHWIGITVITRKRRTLLMKP